MQLTAVEFVSVITRFIGEQGRNRRHHGQEVYEVSAWYGLSVGVLKMLGLFAAVAAAARGLVAFATWRTSWRNRLIGVEPGGQENN